MTISEPPTVDELINTLWTMPQHGKHFWSSIFLGVMGPYDLWLALDTNGWCGCSVVARFGKEDHEYMSLPIYCISENFAYEINRGNCVARGCGDLAAHPLWIAYHLAKARDLLPEPSRTEMSNDAEAVP